MEEGYSLVREFSDLGCYQRRYSVRYGMITDGAQLTLILEKTKDGKKETDLFPIKESLSEKGRQLVQFLYENAIPLENWKDVLIDLTEM